MVGPFEGEEEHLEQLTPRYAVYLPQAYVPQALEQDLTPRAAWETIGAQVISDHREEACKPLLDWLRVALVRQVGSRGSVLAQEAPRAVLVDEQLYRHRDELVLQEPSKGRRYLWLATKRKN